MLQLKLFMQISFKNWSGCNFSKFGCKNYMIPLKLKVLATYIFINADLFVIKIEENSFECFWCFELKQKLLSLIELLTKF